MSHSFFPYGTVLVYYTNPLFCARADETIAKKSRLEAATASAESTAATAAELRAQLQALRESEAAAVEELVAARTAAAERAGGLERALAEEKAAHVATRARYDEQRRAWSDNAE